MREKLRERIGRRFGWGCKEIFRFAVFYLRKSASSAGENEPEEVKEDSVKFLPLLTSTGRILWQLLTFSC